MNKEQSRFDFDSNPTFQKIDYEVAVRSFVPGYELIFNMAVALLDASVEKLEQKGYAYAVDGDVYYKVQNFSEYGKLSGRFLDDMQAGASGRVDLEDPLGQKKHNPFDFALWKAAKPGEPAWNSPWGVGRPGWHIECSAMIRSQLGETIDIHGGGGDLVFPHHENEIAQSEVVTLKPLARYWMHNGMVTVANSSLFGASFRTRSSTKR